MTTDRLLLLYADDIRGANTQQNERIVLLALCQAVKLAARRSGRSLVRTSVTIDEVMHQIPTAFGTPTNPDFRKLLTIAETFRQLRSLEQDGWLTIDRAYNEEIMLTDALFTAIARAWFDKKGGREYEFTRGPKGATTDDVIYCCSIQRAQQVNHVRQARTQTRFAS